MATNTTRLSVDMDSKDHRKLKILAEANGMSLRDFILVLLDPFLHPNRKPNEKTLEAINSVEKERDLQTFKSVEDMWDELGLN